MKKNENNKSFGILFFVVFSLIAVWPIMNEGQVRFWAIVISLTFLLLGIFNSKILSPLRLIWIKFGDILGMIIAPIVMGFIYFLIITPIGLFMRLIGKDLLKIKLRDTRSYWIKREKKMGTFIFKRKEKILAITYYNCFSFIWCLDCFKSRNRRGPFYLHYILEKLFLFIL